jgi:ABC-2 type transport system permease protein
MNVGRIAVLVGKDLREFRANPSVVLPAFFISVVTTLLPLVVVILIPHAVGKPLGSDRFLQQVIADAVHRQPALAALPPESAAEAFLLQQFLFLFVIVPVAGSVSLAAHSVVGEKAGRTLEPLLTTPLSAAEMLVAKAVASFLPALAIEIVSMGVFLLVVGLATAPGVMLALFTLRAFILLGMLGPFAALAALQATIAVSSRVNDPRGAQQIAVVVVLPLMALFVGQIAGAFDASPVILIALSAAVAVVWALLVMFSVALFDRETILTRWSS